MPSTDDDKIKELYKKMFDLTLPKCQGCRVPLSCCSPEYCEFTKDYAKKAWGIELKNTEHPTLPLMGPNGCTADPHLRPLCTLHVCEQHYMKDPKFSKEYFKLREKINDVDTHLREPE